jgi:sugar (pentulose or hexulose) kinase
VTGLWLLRGLAASLPGAPSCDGLERLAAAAPPAAAALDPDDPLFFAPPSMAEAIADFCRATGQEPPAGPGGLARAAYEGIALALRRAIEDAADLSGVRIDRVHLVGGGSRDALLCRLTAEATGRPVLAGPAEATAAGNVLVQAMALGAVGDLAEARAVLRRSAPPVEYTPSGGGRLDEAYGRYLRVREARRGRD